MFANRAICRLAGINALATALVSGMGELIWFTPIIKDESTYMPAQLIADDHEAEVAFGA
ncbi:MAG: hypothetical protein U0892_17685 [Pirellulales bacterium]